MIDIQQRVTVLGSGGWGTALAVMLNEKGLDTVLWSWQASEAKAMIVDRENKEFLPGITLPDSISITNDNEKAVYNSDVIVLAVPSKYIRKTLNDFSPYIGGHQAVVNVSKGLEDKTCLRISEIIHQTVPNCKVAVLSGPSHAEEVSKQIPTAVTVASEDTETARKVQALFMNPTFRVYTSNDIIGVELGGSLKNVIALAAGISDGLNYGDNTKAALITRGIAEISRLGVAMGASADTFAGLSGIGDLIVTCTSMHSRNRRAGIMLGKGYSLDETLKDIHMVVEGVNTACAAYELSLKQQVDMPIVTEINNVLYKGKRPQDAVMELMERDMKVEDW